MFRQTRKRENRENRLERRDDDGVALLSQNTLKPVANTQQTYAAPLRRGRATVSRSKRVNGPDEPYKVKLTHSTSKNYELLDVEVSSILPRSLSLCARYARLLSFELVYLLVTKIANSRPHQSSY